MIKYWTVCERFLSSGQYDNEARSILMRFVKDPSSHHIAIDSESKILDRFRNINGPGSGVIMWWLRTILNRGNFKWYRIGAPQTPHELEIYAQVGSSTPEHLILCYEEADYEELSVVYPDLRLIPPDKWT